MNALDEVQQRRRAALLRRETELLQAIEHAKTGASPVELDQSSVGRLSRMDAMQSQAMNLEAQRRRKLDLGRVRSALQRLADGSYGECIACGESIASARLDHDPSATVCIACARGRD